MSKSRTEAAVIHPLCCTRFPCNTARRRGTHVPDVLGSVTHKVSGDGSDSQGWEVAILAVDDGPWQVGIYLGDRWRMIEPESLSGVGRERDTERETTADAFQNAIALSNAITQAIGFVLLDL